MDLLIRVLTGIRTWGKEKENPSNTSLPVYDITEGDKAKLRTLCELQDKHLERIPKTIRDTDFSAALGVALECNMDVLREVACRIGYGGYAHSPYIAEKMNCVEKWLKEAEIL